jgi:ADP-ribose pyrophosphatase YjhB (NUDIX family)
MTEEPLRTDSPSPAPGGGGWGEGAPPSHRPTPVQCGAGLAGPDGVVREWTVATFVVHRGRVLLLFHPKIGIWLPPGGHIEAGELPDDAAVREVLEETGVRCRLVGQAGVDVAYPVQLVRPFGVQVENIRPGVQHIDLVYFAVVDDEGEPDGWQVSEESAARERAGWYAPEELPGLGANDEIQQWVAKVTTYIGQLPGGPAG